MNFIRVNTYEELSRKAAAIIASQVISKPNCVLGLATGSSPVGTYKKLIEANKQGDLDFSLVTSVNLDEYVGLVAHEELALDSMHEVKRTATQECGGAGGGVDTVCPFVCA